MKFVHRLNLSHQYDAKRKGAKYTINNGESHMNEGDFSEVAAKSVLGLSLEKSNIRFDEGSDVPEYCASVKSSRATLTNVKLADTFEASVQAYFEQTASKEFWYVSIVDNMVTIYRMNAVKFERFIRKFSSLNERGVIRFATTSARMLAWLDTNA